MKKINKCDTGYIEQNKKRKLIYTLTGLFIVAAILVTGIIIYKSKTNYFTVAAAVASLPVAKIAVSFFMFMPYHSTDNALCEELDKICKNVVYNVDCIMTSKEKVMHIDAAVITPAQIIAYTTSSKVDKQYFQKTIKEFEKQGKVKTEVVLFTDKNKFIERVNAVNNIYAEISDYDKETMNMADSVFKVMCM